MRPGRLASTVSRGGGLILFLLAERVLRLANSFRSLLSGSDLAFGEFLILLAANFPSHEEFYLVKLGDALQARGALVLRPAAEQLRTLPLNIGVG